jgi:hypothetical protein
MSKPRPLSAKPDSAQLNIRKIVSDEMVRQLNAMKDEINRDLVEDLKQMRKIITEDVIDEVHRYMDEKMAQVRRTGGSVNTGAITEEVKSEVMADVNKKMEQMNNQLVVSNNKQVALTKQMTKELTGAITQAASQKVYAAVISEINTKIVPKVDNMVQWVNYNMQDGGEIVTDYRRAVEHQSRESDMKLLASSKGEDKKSWGPNGSIRVMWDDDDTGI